MADEEISGAKIIISSEATGDGIEKTTEQVRGLREERDDLNRVQRSSASADEEAGEAMEKFREQATEGRHALHGAHLAVEGLTRASQGGMDAITGLAYAFRGLAMSAGAGILGGVTLALTAIIELWESHKKKVEEQKKAFEDVDDEVGNTRDKVNELVQKEIELLNPVDQWKDALTQANEALDVSLDTIKSMNAEQAKLLDSQEKLALARTQDRTDLMPEEKESGKYAIQEYYAGLKQENADSTYDADIATRQAKIDAAKQAATGAAQDAAKAKVKLDAALKKQQERQEWLEHLKTLAEYHSEGDTGYAGMRMAIETLRLQGKDTPAAEKKWRDMQEANSGPDYSKNFAEYMAKGGQGEIDQKADQKAVDDAKANYLREQEGANKQGEEASKEEFEGGAKISQLQNEKATADQIFQNNQQAAAAEEDARIRKQQAEAADKAARARAKQQEEIQEAAEKAREEAEKNALKNNKGSKNEKDDTIGEIQGVAAEARSEAGSSNLNDSKAVRDAADQLSKNPLDEQLAQHLRDLVENLLSHTNALETQRRQQMVKTFNDLNRIIESNFNALQRKALLNMPGSS